MLYVNHTLHRPSVSKPIPKRNATSVFWLPNTFTRPLKPYWITSGCKYLSHTEKKFIKTDFFLNFFEISSLKHGLWSLFGAFWFHDQGTYGNVRGMKRHLFCSKYSNFVSISPFVGNRQSWTTYLLEDFWIFRFLLFFLV